jgi:hypothetical protein
MYHYSLEAYWAQATNNSGSNLCVFMLLVGFGTVQETGTEEQPHCATLSTVILGCLHPVACDQIR